MARLGSHFSNTIDDTCSAMIRTFSQLHRTLMSVPADMACNVFVAIAHLRLSRQRRSIYLNMLLGRLYRPGTAPIDGMSCHSPQFPFLILRSAPTTWQCCLTV